MDINKAFLPHTSAALEYWYFKVNSGSVALLVDWIIRRKLNENTLRISIHTPKGREVIFEKITGDLMGPNCFLDLTGTKGSAQKVAWDLRINHNNKIVAPDIFPAGLLNMPDLQVIIFPLVHFSGWIQYGDEKYSLDQSKGMMSHYWGRKLSQEWWWISANQFDNPEIAVECSIIKSGLWGSKMKIPLAYLYLNDGIKSRLVMPLPGTVSVKGNREEFELKINSPGAADIILKAKGREYGDLGEGIMNTLVGDLEIFRKNKLIGKAQGTAGLERLIGE